jgi:hypothetical protein
MKALGSTEECYWRRHSLWLQGLGAHSAKVVDEWFEPVEARGGISATLARCAEQCFALPGGKKVHCPNGGTQGYRGEIVEGFTSFNPEN